MSSPTDPLPPTSEKARLGWREMDVPAILITPGMLFVPWLLLVIFLIRDQQPDHQTFQHRHQANR